MISPRRNIKQKCKDFITFPIRAGTLFWDDKWGLSSLASERFDYVSREVIGYCLDVGCGRHNRFINEYLLGNGKGIDVYPYEGLSEENIVKDITHFPFTEGVFDSVTFIANINHIPEHQRDIELAEAYRVLREGGNIIITMGNPLTEIIFHTKYDVDPIRGMDKDERYYLKDFEIIEMLTRARFINIRKKYFVTQWGFNHLFVGHKG